jgi:hypothetical protein
VTLPPSKSAQGGESRAGKAGSLLKHRSIRKRPNTKDPFLKGKEKQNENTPV